MKKYIHIFLNFFIKLAELKRKPSLNWAAKAILGAALATLLSSSFSLEIPIPALDTTLTFGGADLFTFFVLLVTALAIFGYTEYRDVKEADDSILTIIRHMGLVDNEIDDLRNYLPKKLRRIKPQHFVISYENSNKTTDKSELNKQLEHIRRIPAHLTDTGHAGNNAKKHIAYGGVAPVPMLAAAGHVISNMQNVHIGDWERQKKRWHFNSQFDDGEELVFHVDGDDNADAESVSLAVSFSIPVNLKCIHDEFSESPLHVVTLPSGEHKYDRLCSEEKQDRLAIAILEFINNKLIPNYSNLGEINVFVTAQASFIFRLGSVMNQGHLPRVIFHHYDRNRDGAKHPWGVVLNDNEMGYKVV
ncbi:SAVED domain-containing protein [Pseudoalteromonas piratica]|uniref:SMODS-associated and fused to various effectors domain-containing protein n=1 Tax=Pseudoalteromonas piratica TaxID=1348114 RepID=A0A0A7EHN5_9GAMM|nr:SAVED domain-containing protein [Pseudoalteromonas piratica]AIY66114.1 hypothetical protein OM33_14090 [Pseudoalteromonas piratica]